MKVNKDNLELSGKGAIVSQELLHDNIKVVTKQTQFHEVLLRDGEESHRIGWLVPNELELLADFTAHTSTGARGKSTHDTISQALILDAGNFLAEIIPENLIDVDVSDSQEILDAMFSGDSGKISGDIKIDDINEEKGLILLSPRSEYVFIKADDASIRIHGEDGIYVLKSEDGKDRLIVIDKDDGVHIIGDKEINIGPGGIKFNGKEFDVGSIIGSALAGIAPVFAGLAGLANLGNIGNFGNFGNFNNFGRKGGPRTISFSGDGDFAGFDDMEEFERKMEKMGEKLGKMGEKLGRKFEKQFGSGFGQGFGSDFGDDFDTDFSDAHDVDIDYEE